MRILTFLFGNKKDLPFKKKISFERENIDIDLDIGEELNIWNKPQSNQVNIYAKGTIGGQGLVGTTFNSSISYHLQNTDDLFIENKIVSLSKNRIDLFIHLYADSNAAKQNFKNEIENWVNKMTKKYNPKKNWTIRFYSDNKLDEDEIIIKTVEKENIKDFYTKSNETIWLTDKNGAKLEIENRLYAQDTEKTLRTLYSGHKLEIFAMYRDNNYYFFEIGIKK
jgi:hypothetical protein